MQRHRGLIVARTLHAERDSLAQLKNVGKAALADFALLGITSVGALATKDSDALYVQLCEIYRRF